MTYNINENVVTNDNTSGFIKSRAGDEYLVQTLDGAHWYSDSQLTTPGARADADACECGAPGTVDMGACGMVCTECADAADAELDALNTAACMDECRDSDLDFTDVDAGNPCTNAAGCDGGPVTLQARADLEPWQARNCTEPIELFLCAQGGHGYNVLDGPVVSVEFRKGGCVFEVALSSRGFDALRAALCDFTGNVVAAVEADQQR